MESNGIFDGVTLVADQLFPMIYALVRPKNQKTVETHGVHLTGRNGTLGQLSVPYNVEVEKEFADGNVAVKVAVMRLRMLTVLVIFKNIEIVILNNVVAGQSGVSGMMVVHVLAIILEMLEDEQEYLVMVKLEVTDVAVVRKIKNLVKYLGVILQVSKTIDMSMTSKIVMSQNSHRSYLISAPYAFKLRPNFLTYFQSSLIRDNCPEKMY